MSCLFYSRFPLTSFSHCKKELAAVRALRELSPGGLAGLQHYWQERVLAYGERVAATAQLLRAEVEKRQALRQQQLEQQQQRQQQQQQPQQQQQQQHHQQQMAGPQSTSAVTPVRLIRTADRKSR